jgi:hypothetical protein
MVRNIIVRNIICIIDIIYITDIMYIIIDIL